MSRTIQVLGVGVFLLAEAIGVTRADAASGPERGVRIRIYDYVGIQPRELRKVEGIASDILRNAGVAVDWMECRISQDHPVKDPRCESEPTPPDLHLRIVGPEMAEAAGTHSDSFGYAWIVDGYGFIAAAYYHRAVEMEKSNQASRWAVLGGVIAHEVGHLLLGDERHSKSGIMSPGWGRLDLKRIAQGRLRFSPEQIRRMGHAIVARATSDEAVAALQSVDVAALCIGEVENWPASRSSISQAGRSACRGGGPLFTSISLSVVEGVGPSPGVLRLAAGWAASHDAVNRVSDPIALPEARGRWRDFIVPSGASLLGAGRG